MPLVFLPLQESHFSLLLKWLEAPHVKAWWDQDVHWTPELIKNKYKNYGKGFKRLDFQGYLIEKPIHAFIICREGREIGYIQYYNAYDFPREQGYEIESLPENMAALDVFIGEKDRTSRGLGPLVIKTFLLEHVFKYFDAVFVDPDTANIKAIRAYEKAGFKKVKEGTIIWMVKKHDK